MRRRRAWPMRYRALGRLVLGLSWLAAAAFAQGSSGPAAPNVSSIVGPPRGTALAGPALVARTEEVASLLRCPVCQGLSVADSPSGMAQDMKKEVGELLAAGYDEDQILAYFERSYGEFVRLEPPLRGVNWIVWLAPLLGLLAGAWVVRWTLRRPRTAADSADPEPVSDDPPPAPDALPEDPRLAASVLKVRERAYGWPGGLPPKGPPA